MDPAAAVPSGSMRYSRPVSESGVLTGIARRAASREPMELLDRCAVTVEAGVASDFRGRPGARQVTVLSQEAWRAANEELGRTGDELLDWRVRRANLLVTGLDLAETRGRRLRIGDEVELEITGETVPCERMEEQQAGLLRALAPDWRGGVTARVVRGGSLAKGDPVRLA